MVSKDFSLKTDWSILRLTGQFCDSLVTGWVIALLVTAWTTGSVRSKVVTGSGHKTDKKSDSSLKTGASQSQDQHHEINYSN